jgi:hypothetical protein
MALGLAVRFGHVGLPGWASKYGGSALWAMLLYWVVSGMFGTRPVGQVALGTAVLAAGVECLKLYHSAGLDGFRLTLAGKLLLGRVFSGWDIAVYWVAIGAAAWLDLRLRRKMEPRLGPRHSRSFQDF